jgi:NADH-quinone oxidoreductase subunit L
VPGAGLAYLATLLGVFVGGFYSFRLIFYTFHGKERFADPHHPDVKALEAERAAERAANQKKDAHGAHDDHSHDAHEENEGHAHAPHESPAVVTVPLILLAIPSACAGWVIGTLLYGNFFGGSIVFSPQHPVMAALQEEFHGVVPMMLHGMTALPFWFALAGAGAAGYLYLVRPDLPAVLRRKAGVLVTILMDKYGFDRFNDWFFAGGARLVGGGLWKGGDVAVIDGFVNGSARAVGWFASVVRTLQSGFIYHYAFAMIIGILVLLTMVLL